MPLEQSATVSDNELFRDNTGKVSLPLRSVDRKNGTVHLFSDRVTLDRVARNRSRVCVTMQFGDTDKLDYRDSEGGESSVDDSRQKQLLISSARDAFHISAPSRGRRRYEKTQLEELERAELADTVAALRNLAAREVDQRTHSFVD